MQPSNAIAATSHPDPYPYYRRLQYGPDLVFDPAIGCWVASRAAVIEEVLANPLCVVRPAAEPVPRAIAGSSAGELFGRLIRMNEGCPHASGKRVLGDLLTGVDLSTLHTRSVQLAALLAARHGLDDGAAITRWMVDLPTYVTADLLGFAAADLAQVARWTADFVRCLSPLSTPTQLSNASIAAQALTQSVAQVLNMDGLARQAARHNWTDQETLIANLVGLLSQTHEATAGWIGSCIVALCNEPGVQQRLRANPQLATGFAMEVARSDAAVQNTRRFVTQPVTIARVPLQAGDVVLLVLGAAGRDEEANPAPDVFSLERAQRRLAGFGHARHACPGQDIALTIVTGAVLHLLSVPEPVSKQSIGWKYAPSTNGRLPQFFTPY